MPGNFVIGTDMELGSRIRFLLAVNSVSVNYAFRFSGPVTALTARRVRYGVGTGPHLPTRPSASYKDAFVPAAFSTALCIPFSPSFLLHGRRALGLTELHLSLPTSWAHRKIRRGQ
jgi:hypothetical protein